MKIFGFLITLFMLLNKNSVIFSQESDLFDIFIDMIINKPLACNYECSGKYRIVCFIFSNRLEV